MSPVDRQPAAGEDTLAHILEGGRAALGDLTGTTVGDFQVERLLGRGGMGEVYLATQLSLNRPVALKVLREEVMAKPGYEDRFRSEAIAVAKLNHPNIVHVYSMAQIDQVHFIAMEYVEGTNLREYVAKRGALDVLQSLSIMKQTAQAIGAAGEAGLIHRDVKPENILITRRGRVKVADFGLCRHMDEEGAHLTQVGTTMGTPAYMSPEQAQGHPLDHRSDLYSMGATYYFMLAALPPFRGDSPVAVALKQVREIPCSLLVHRPDLPVEIDRLVMKLMAKDPGDRYQSAAEMLADLSKIREAIQLPAGSAGAADALDGPYARTDEVAIAAPRGGELALRAREPSAPVVAAPRVGRGATPAPVKARVVAVAEPDDRPAPPRPVFSGMIATAAIAIGLCAGGLAGWAARAPDLMALSSEPVRRPPGLWIEPRWAAIPKQTGGAEDQLRHAQLRASRDDWAAAWLAVPGYYPHSHDAASKAYTQLARLWYRLDDLESLAALGTELSAWKEAQQRDKDLAALIALALQLKKGDLGAVEKGFEKLSDGDVADMYDPALVAMNLEVCSDALQAVRKSGNLTIEAPLRKALRQLARQLHHIEIGEAAGALRANPAGGVAPRAKAS
jgi:predicted Ser/Thr protein kinase